MKIKLLLILFNLQFYLFTFGQPFVLDVYGDGLIQKRLVVGSATSTNSNIYIGVNTGLNNTTGDKNTFIGNHSGQSNTIGIQNTFIGNDSGKSNTGGNQNTFVGNHSGQNNTTGWFNTFLGINSGQSNTGAPNNTFLGAYSGQKNNGNNNTFIGKSSGFVNSTGTNNVFIGTDAGNTNTTGIGNIYIGYATTGISGNLLNSIAIGTNARVDASNKIVLGNTSLAVIETGTNVAITSDLRYKKNIKKETTVKQLDFILQLQPVSYQYNTTKLIKEQYTKLQEFSKRNTRNNNQSEELKDDIDNSLEISRIEELKAAKEKDKIFYTGFLAQEVDKIAKKVSYDKFSGIVQPEINGGKYALRYAEFVVPLVGAVQEQQKQIKVKEDRIKTLEAKVAQLEKLLNKVIAGNDKGNQSVIIQRVGLGQNTPNPFNNSTLIPYTIPNTAQKARIEIYGINGQLIEQIPITAFGEGTLEIQTKALTSGIYTYSLIVDNRMIATKKMNIFK